MEPLKISDFYKYQAPIYAAYDNTRKIVNYIDGLKISMRKLLYTVQQKYNTGFIKSETLANIATAYTNYLHGAANLGGVINTMTEFYVSANNYPLFVGNDMGFGTRINPTCAASRYTKVALSDISKELFNKTDLKLIEPQYFEGDYIEPMYFAPIFPVVLLNSSEGVSTGFSSKIYSRNPEEVIEYIKKKLSGTVKPKLKLLPWFRGFTGTVRTNEKGVNECCGVINKINTTTYEITEIPIGIEYSKYCNILDDLCEKKIIVDYKDKCDPKKDNILFEIKTTREFTVKHKDIEDLLGVFKLIKSLPEQLNCIDEFNRVRAFSSVQEILDAFIEIRLSYYQKRKDYLVKETKRILDILYSKYLFCKGVIDETINVRNVPNAKIIAQLEKIDKIIKVDDSYDYLLRIPIGSITKEGLEKLKKDISENKELYKLYKDKDYKEFWIDDLKELKEKIM